MRYWKKLLRRRLMLPKRQLFVVITFVLTAGLMLTQLVSSEWRYLLVILLAILTLGLTAFGLREDLDGAEWVTLLTLPTFYTTAVALLYLLLPERWLTRLPVAILYTIGIYALLLTENIYNVSAARTIALLRAAHSIGFIITLVTFFLLLQTALAFRLSAGVNALVVGLISGPLLLQNLWSVELGPVIGKRIWQLTLALTVVLVELSWTFSFWPTRTTLQALFLTTCFYSLAGMAQQYLAQRLYKRTIIEFFTVNVIVLIIVILATRWRTGLL